MNASDASVVDSVPIIFLVDTTSSMKGGPIDAVNSRLRYFVEHIRSHSPAAASSLSLSVISFNGEAELISSPKLLSDIDLPLISASDVTATMLGGALQIAVDLIGDDEPVDDLLKPILVVLTDGLPQDKNSLEFSNIISATESSFSKKFVFVALPAAKQSQYDCYTDSTTFSYVCDVDFIDTMFSEVNDYIFSTFGFEPSSDVLDIDDLSKIIEDLDTFVQPEEPVTPTVEEKLPVTIDAPSTIALTVDTGTPPVINVQPPKPAQINWVGDWLPPFGKGHGLRLTDQSLKLIKKPAPNGTELEHKTFQLPASGMYSFVVASRKDQPSVCLAIPRRNGALAVCRYDTSYKLNWEIIETDIDHHAVPESRLPLDSWSAVIVDDEDVDDKYINLLSPSDEGPCVLKIDLSTHTYHIDIAEGECLGGVAKIQASSYVPVYRNGKLEIACLNNKVWSYSPLSEEPLSEKPYFNCPLVFGPKKRIIWIGKAGYILIEQGKSSFNAWPHGWTAKPEFGTPFEDTEGYWQLCFNPALETRKYGYVLIHKTHSGLKLVDGPRMSTGKSSYAKKSIFKSAPWEESEEFGVEPFVFPLLQSKDAFLHLGIQVDNAQESITLSKLMDSPARHIFNLRSSLSDLPLMKGSQQSPWKGLIFIFGDFLNFYSEPKGEIYAWALEK
jgi:uncharacterized protein YegL